MAVLIFVLAGCTGVDKEDTTLDIVCSIFPQYDFARAIAGDVEGVNIKMLLRPGQESHDFDPSSKDIAAVHDCDIFVYTGGVSDSWIENMLESVDTENKTVISLMGVVEPLAEEAHDHGDDDHDHGVIDHVDYDEHVWTSPKNAVIIAEAICEAMCEHMPEAAESFTANFAKLKGELTSLDTDFSTLAQSVESPTIVVADRFPLLYMCREYGITYYAAFSGCAASTEPSSKTLQFLIDKVKSDNIPVVLKMDLSGGNVANTIAEATGAEVMTYFSCHTLLSADFEGGETYVSLMRKNYDTLRRAFGVE